MTVLYFLIAIPASRTRSLLLLAAHHICFEIMFMMNFIVVVVFWSLLYNEAISDCAGDQKKILNVYYAHVGPGVSALINYAITDVRLTRSHVKMVFTIAALYGYVNYLETKKRGAPLYWFLTWEDSTSVLIYLSLMVVFTGLWFVLCGISYALKPVQEKVKK